MYRLRDQLLKTVCPQYLIMRDGTNSIRCTWLGLGSNSTNEEIFPKSLIDERKIELCTLPHNYLGTLRKQLGKRVPVEKHFFLNEIVHMATLFQSLFFQI